MDKNNKKPATNIKFCLYARKSSGSDERQAISINSQTKEMLAILAKLEYYINVNNLKIVKKMKNKKTQKLKKIRDQVWNLTDSPFYEYRKKNNYYPVIGEGSHFAKIIFIGEAPGKNEAETGKPFCGASGKILDKLLESINIKRQDIYITNIVKDRPPENRDPTIKEIKIYSPFLIRQLEIIKPEVIATLGRFSMEFVMKLYGLEGKLQKISLLHGQIFETKTSWGNIKIIPFYHPAVALYNANQLDLLKNDFQVLK